jgi:hypothetical protein
MTELRDINIALIGQEPDRLNSMQAIRVVVLYPGDGYTIIEWATFDAPVNVFDPPGWDETAILNQLIREEMESSRVERKP